MVKNEQKILFLLSAIICILICISSYEGFINPDFYGNETLNWQAQSVGQDLINLFLIGPVLLITSFMVLLKKAFAYPLWAGALLYLIYTYQIYCFNIHFNSYFIAYCLILGLCFYLFVYFVYSQIKLGLRFKNNPLNKPIAFYFLIIAVLFYLLWLGDILPAIVYNTVPESVKKGGLVSNPVQVLDLSIVLPGVFVTGILLLKKKSLGLLFSPILLTFFILMDLTISLLTIVMVNKGVESNYTVAIVMAFLATISAILLIQQLKITIQPI